LYCFLRGIPVVQTWHELGYLTNPFRFWRFIVAHGMVTLLFVPGGLVLVRPDYKRHVPALLRPIVALKTVRHIPNASAIPSIHLTQQERGLIRSRYARPDSRIVVFFGLLYSTKRVELLFEIADPRDSHLVIIGGSIRPMDLSTDLSWAPATQLPEYEQMLRNLSARDPWRGKVSFTGFLTVEEAARVIACADAVVLPLQNGAGEWNTSLHAAQAQGTFTLTTSITQQGYDRELNTYYCAPEDVAQMRAALTQYAGTRAVKMHHAEDAWSKIRSAHLSLYAHLLTRVQSKPTRIRRFLARAVLHLA
jgi:glycosyltransferase involved in cell wall biosynthesis